MAKTSEKRTARIKRKARIKRRIKVESGRPRLAVFRSNKHIYAQVIDDLEGRTLAAASTTAKGFKVEGKGAKSMEAAKGVGKAIAEAAKKAKVSEVCFDRGGYRFQGRIKALADAARENGLKF